MTVLVTGGAGFIGRRVVAALLDAGHEVRVLDSLRPDVHRGSPPELPGVELLVGDVRDEGALQQALAGADAVLHLAAKVGLGVDVQDLPDYASTNDYGTAMLLAAMARAGVERLVLASSMVVYGEGLGLCPAHGLVSPAPRQRSALQRGQFEPPCPRCGRTLGPALVSEDAPVDPRNAYAASKLAQEHLAGAWARQTGGSVAALRFHDVYGPGLPRDTPYAGVAAIWLSELVNGRPPRVFEDGGQRRDFVHVDDVAAACRAALQQHAAGTRAFNVGSGIPRTIGELAQGLATAFGGPAPVVTGDFRLGDVRHITADSTRLQTELAVRPQVSFTDGVAALALGR